MLGSDGEATLVITPKESFESVTVRPLDKKIKPEIHSGAVKITFPGAGQYSVEFDDMHHVLTVFIDPEKDFGIDENDENVLYFASGVHYSEEITTLDDNERSILRRARSFTEVFPRRKRKISAYSATAFWTIPALSAAKARRSRFRTVKTYGWRALRSSTPPHGRRILQAAPT